MGEHHGRSITELSCPCCFSSSPLGSAWVAASPWLLESATSAITSGGTVLESEPQLGPARQVHWQCQTDAICTLRGLAHRGGAAITATFGPSWLHGSVQRTPKGYGSELVASGQHGSASPKICKQVNKHQNRTTKTPFMTFDDLYDLLLLAIQQNDNKILQPPSNYPVPNATGRLGLFWQLWGRLSLAQRGTVVAIKGGFPGIGVAQLLEVNANLPCLIFSFEILGFGWI